jgi:Zn-dependent peptidase ImmA (M78 family)
MSIDPVLKKQVISLREECGYTNSEPVNLHSILFKINVITYFKPLSDDFSGMAFRYNNFDFILVNSDQAIGRQNFTVAHELYHLRFQKDFETHKCQISDLGGNKRTEQKANLFAALFLLPEEALLDNIPESELKKNAITVGTLLRLEQIFEVSHTFLLYRLKSLKLIDEKKRKEHSSYSIKQKVSEYGFPIDLYESGNHNKVIGDYGLVAKKLLDENKVSEGHYLELMKVLSK